MYTAQSSGKSIFYFKCMNVASVGQIILLIYFLIIILYILITKPFFRKIIFMVTFLVQELDFWCLCRERPDPGSHSNQIRKLFEDLTRRQFFAVFFFLVNYLYTSHCKYERFFIFGSSFPICSSLKIHNINSHYCSNSDTTL